MTAQARVTHIVRLALVRVVGVLVIRQDVRQGWHTRQCGPFLLRRLRGAKSVDPSRQDGTEARDEPHYKGGDTYRLQPAI